jgi:glycosyltransferase involved in cell wall biosynthesis
MAERALVVIPTYNERGNLQVIVPQILEQDPRLEVLVVDDNSPDGTGQLADELAGASPRVHVLHRPSKAGLGKAYLAGFRWALDRGYDSLSRFQLETTTSSSRWTPISATTRSICPICSGPSRTPIW